MNMLKRLIHISLSVLSALLIVGVPAAVNLDIFTDQSLDAVSQASMQLPEQPSGNFFVLVKTIRHEKTIDDWRSFFNDEYAVIFDDIHCLVAEGDESGKQLAERYQSQLPENQMTVRTENPTLLVSKAEAGYIDVVIMSKEMADALEFTAYDTLEDITVIKISGGGE